MTGKSLCCFTYWTNTETPIVFGRNVTGQSQVWEPCCLCSDPIPFLNVFTYKRQNPNNGILTDLSGRACPYADSAGKIHPNSYLHISTALHQKENRNWDHKHGFSSSLEPLLDMNKGALNLYNWRCHNKLHLDIFCFCVLNPHPAAVMKSSASSEKSISRVGSHRQKELREGIILFYFPPNLSSDLAANY